MTPMLRTLIRSGREQACVVVCLLAGTLLMTAPTSASEHLGRDWEGDAKEDAGDKPGTAQKVIIDTSTQVKTIAGELKGDSEGLAGDPGDYQDCYKVVIKNPGTFVISTLPPLGSSTFDTLLGVYDESGRALLANDDGEQGALGSRVGSQSSSGKFVIDQPGTIIISVSGAQSRPITEDGLPVFAFSDNPLEVVGPSQAGLAKPFAGWDQPGQVGFYVVELTSVSPIPSSCAVENTEDCFMIHATPYCDDSACCEATCAVEPFCCEVTWDATCASVASFLCGDGEGGCGSEAAESCRDAHNTPYCDDPVCCAIVCEELPECCSIEWDQSCVDLANNICPPPCNFDCPADLDFSGFVDGADLSMLLAKWGQPGCQDLNGNGTTDGADIAILLGSWGACKK